MGAAIFTPNTTRFIYISGASFITIAYTQKRAWNVRTPLSKHKLGFIFLKIDEKMSIHLGKLWPMCTHFMEGVHLGKQRPCRQSREIKKICSNDNFIQLFRIWKPSNTITCQRKIHAWVIVLLPIKHITKNKNCSSFFNVHQGASTSPNWLTQC